MKTKQVLLLALLALCTLHSTLSTSFAQGTAFTYQGQLSASGSPASGNYDFTFALFNNSSTNTGQQIGNTLTNLDVGVTNGLFIATLNFGDVFTGTNYWLAIGVRSNGGASFTALNPLQELTPTPYAIYTPNAGNAASANSVAATDITGTIPLAQLPAALVTNTETAVTLSGTFAGNGGGLTDLNASQLASIGNTSGAQNFFVGSAGNASVSGFYNTGLGYAALAAITTGAQDTAIGNQALAVNTSGSQNTALGSGALYSNLSGGGNTANGFLALRDSTTASDNTALGVNALGQLGVNNSAGGSNNIALGYQAGYNFTGNESSNIDIGSPGVQGENYTMRLGTPGIQTNTFIAGVINGNGGGLTNLSAANLTGTAPTLSVTNLNLDGTLSLPPVTTENGPDIIYGGVQTEYSGDYFGNLLLYADYNENFYSGDAGNENATASANTGVGFGALYNNSGNNNTALGEDAMEYSEGGGDNTAIGVLALWQNYTGSDNTAVGAGALVNLGMHSETFFNETLSSGSNNIALGVGAGSAFVWNESSNIDIGSPGVQGENYTMRLGTPGIQTNTFIAGVINGNGGGLTNLSAANLTGTAPTLSVTNLNLDGTLSLPPVTTENGPDIIYGGVQTEYSGDYFGNLLLYADYNENFYSGDAGNENATASANTGVGFGALYNNSGNNNTALGEDAMEYSEGGGDNTAIGVLALWQNYTGSDNTAVGAGALVNLGMHSETFFNETLSSGSNNIALGVGAGSAFVWNESSNIDIGSPGVQGENYTMRLGTPGIQTNTFIAGVINGNGGGLTNLTINASQLAGSSNQNVFVGPAGNSVAAGSDNTAVGSGAFYGYYGNSGSDNTALGAGTLFYNQSGSANTAVGDNALNTVFTGSNNTALGGSALMNTGGSANIALGYQAGLNITSGSSNIDIGNPGVSTDANIIRIGSNQTAAYIAGVITGNGSGLANLNASQLTSGTIPTSVLPGLQSGSNYSTIDSGQNNTVSGSTDSVIAGGQNNTLTNVNGSAIAGGVNNTNNGNQSTISGGAGNGIQVGAYYALLGSGGGNVIETNSDTAFLGAGYHNLIGTNAPATVLGGGQYNVISNNATLSVLGGGYQNTNTGPYSVIPGGINNVATTNSFAAGSNALATNTSAFVWSDGSASTTSTNTNSVTFRAAGGYRLFTSSGASGAFLGANQTSWATISDRDAKKNFQPVDPKAVLDKLAAIPIQQWNYKWEKDSDVPNIGPMAQDFKAAFYPGRDDKSISTLEFDGVELAAIQGLNQKLNEKDAEIEKLKQSVDELKKMVQLLAEKK